MVMITPPWRKLMVVAGLAAAIGVAGCSSGGPPSGVASISGSNSPTSTSAAGPGSGNANEQDAMLKFAACMRKNGVDMPDPKPGQADGMPGVSPNDPAAAQKAAAALSACEKLMPNGGQPTAQDNERALKFAQCLRAHGVNVPDPNANGGGTLPSFDTTDPKAKAALAACAPSGSTPAGATSGQ